MTNPLLSDITARLAPISDTPSLDSSVLLAHIVNKPRSWVVAHPELALTTDQQEKLTDSLARLERGESFPYILGHWEFYGLNYDITPDVLIPRPETELLVERAINWLSENPNRRSIVDVGTGSGIIATSIAVNVPDAVILATDISPKALEIAKRNVEKYNVNSRVVLTECDLLPAHSSIISRQNKIDLLCANLPYVPTSTMLGLSIYGKEPTIALDGGRDGFVLIRKLMEIAPAYLSSNALMLLEIEASLGREALKLAHEKFPDSRIQLHKDLTDRDRLLEIAIP